MVNTARRALPAALLLAALFTPMAAEASHYRLPADGLVSADELRVLARADIHTTEDLLQRTAALAAREALARTSRISLARLTTLACQADLLRVEGIGPSMVRLLQSGGVRHTRDLRQAAAPELFERLRAANAIHNVTAILPPQEVLEDWIAQAGRLEWILEGTR